MDKTQKFLEKLRSDLHPKAAYAAKHDMTPNHFFISSVLLSLIGGIIVMAGWPLHWPLLFVPIILFIRLLSSNTAIVLMCEHKMTTPLNIFLAELHVSAADALLFLPFGFIEDVSAILVVTSVILGILSEMVGIIAVPMINSRRHDGPIDATDRAFVFGVIALLLGVGLPGLMWVNIVLLVLVILQLVTLANRVRKVIQLAD